MFLSIADILINLLIVELQRQDGIEKMQGNWSEQGSSYNSLEGSPEQPAKSNFSSTSSRIQTLKWQDLTGREVSALLKSWFASLFHKYKDGDDTTELLLIFSVD